MAVRGKKSAKLFLNVITHPKKVVVLILRAYKNEQEYILCVDLVKLTFAMALVLFYYLYYSYV